MHRIADPQHAPAVAADRFQQRRQLLGDLGRAHAVDEGQAARLVFRIQHIDQAQQLIGRDRRPHLDGDRIAHAAQVLHVRAVDRRGAHANPREVRAQVEPAPLARHFTGQRFLVRQQQRFVRGIEIDAIEIVDFGTGQGLHEAHGITNRAHHVLVLGRQRRVAHPAQVPVFWMVQVGETAVDQRAHEIHRHRRTRMRLDHPARIRDPRLRGELRPVDQIAAVAGQRGPIAGLVVGRTWLGVLAGEPSHPHHRQAQAMHQHQAHLQQDLQPVGDESRFAVAETLGAVTTLQQEAFAFLCLGQLLLQREDFPRRHQRRQLPKFGQRRRELRGVGIGRHLHRRPFAPTVGRPVRGQADGAEIAIGGAHGGFLVRSTMVTEWCAASNLSSSATCAA